ncbi:MAG: hypothetical protein ACXWL2_04810 [Candidatus Chromulinivorax sp.]
MTKSYITLERYNQHFYPLHPEEFQDVRHLAEYLSTDHRMYDESFFEQEINFYNSSFIYHNLADKTLHIGFSEWEVNTDIPVPCDHAFPTYVNATNSCKISLINFKEFIKNWFGIKQSTSSLAIIFRNEEGIIICKGFTTTEEMDVFLLTIK